MLGTALWDVGAAEMRDHELLRRDFSLALPAAASSSDKRGTQALPLFGGGLTRGPCVPGSDFCPTSCNKRNGGISPQKDSAAGDRAHPTLSHGASLPETSGRCRRQVQPQLSCSGGDGSPKELRELHRQTGGLQSRETVFLKHLPRPDTGQGGPAGFMAWIWAGPQQASRTAPAPHGGEMEGLEWRATTAHVFMLLGRC